LWAWVQDNAPLITEAQWQTKAAAQKSVGYYSDGDGSTTFRLPRLVGFMEGVTAANVGAFTGAGLPNITGNTGGIVGDYTVGGAPSGALSNTSIVISTYKYGTAGNISTVTENLDASRSSAIYGNSDTVQPESVGMVWCVRAFGAAVNQGTVDITELAQSLNLKLSISDAPATCTPYAFPSDTYVSITITANPMYYTAPADGYFLASGYATASTNYIYIERGRWIAQATSPNINVPSQEAFAILPVKRGDNVFFLYSNMTNVEFRFYYAQGEV
jgi:hypothetical protein